jgi:hypothetical protein
LISTVSGTLFTTLKIGPCCSKRLPVLKPGRGFFQSTQLVAVRSLICPDGKAPHHGGLAPCPKILLHVDSLVCMRY